MLNMQLAEAQQRRVQAMYRMLGLVHAHDVGWHNVVVHVNALMIGAAESIDKRLCCAWTLEQIHYLTICAGIIARWLTGRPEYPMRAYEMVNGTLHGSSFMYAVIEASIVHLWPQLLRGRNPVFLPWPREGRTLRKHKELVAKCSATFQNEHRV